MRVERISGLPPGFPALRDAALDEGWRLLRVLEEDFRSGALRFDAPGEGIFAAWQSGNLAGMLGLSRDPYAEEPGIARLRRLYVLPSQRRAGVGRALVEATAAAASSHGFNTLRVRSPGSARRFYEACGFLPAVLRSATHIRPL
ncbi:GNAT family N-acetyltransferase [Roseomonas sp. SSH11]|uniref:GNAT family N-acetyltransferase n=1 Tax=Pararoseomonas baculiformis TaxID=2820812 RepID=A0ABS4AAX2_9PROT|nr:GNAT family N-acetyltransferase [Pararoseomonas baculiformis]MBP0444011.1 GNAT family N-acetyltransferase [Pararoseomonas baculiformis]